MSAFGHCLQTAGVKQKDDSMIGKLTLASALMIASVGFASAQQSGSSPNTGASSQCWDAQANQVRNQSTAAAPSGTTTGSGSTMNSGSGTGSSGNTSSAPSGTRPAGMANC